MTLVTRVKGEVMKRSIRLIAMMTAALLALSISSANAEPSYYPEGPQRNVPLETVLDGGWTLCFEDSYSNEEALVSEMLDACTDGLIMLAGREEGSNEILLLAAATIDEVFRVTSGQFEVHFANGTYWYFAPYDQDVVPHPHSIGFSGTDVVDIWTCDWLASDREEGEISLEDSENKLCWHIDTNEEDQPYFEGGYRIGEMTGGLDGYLRQVYMAPGTGMRDPLFAQDARFNSMVSSCRRDFTAEIRALVAPSLSEYQDCMFYDVTRENISRVNADALAAYKASVTAGKPMTEAEVIVSVQNLALRYSVLEKLVKSPGSVYLNDLINIGLVGLSDVKSRYQALNTIRSLSDAVKSDYAALQAVVAGLAK